MTAENVSLSIDINSGNAALVDDPIGEVARILRDLADRIESRGADFYGLLDINGNKVGTAHLEIEEEEDEDE